jgi:ribosomal protein S18 acetylase RimI-like enzyme
MMCPLADRAQTHLIAKAELEVEPWSERYLEDAAVLIADSYAGHVDGKINDQYRSLTGARRFLQNIVQYPGCGSFQAGASRLAWRKSTGRLCGLALASLVAGDTGHITQICVSPNSRGEGIGRALLTCSMEALRSMHCRNVSLTVTASNRNAIALYESLGFYTRRRFSAMVWDNLRAPRKYFR